MVDGGVGSPRKSRAWLGWGVAVAFAAALFAALVVMRMPRPAAIEPPQSDAAKQPSADQPEQQAVPQQPATVATQPVPPVTPTAEPEHVPDFDARRFSAEFTSARGAENWPELFAPDVVPQPFVIAANRDDFPDLTAAEWQRWLEPVENEPAEVTFEERSSTSLAHLAGMLQLRCPWPRDGVLYFTPMDSRIFMFWFWSGTQGVSLVFHPQGNVAWAAYRLERAADSRRPHSIALASLDNPAAKITPDGSFNIHHQAGDLIVSLSGIRLLTLPFAGPPQAVYINGDSRFRTFGMDRRLALSETPAAGEASLVKSEPAPDMDWIPLPSEAGRGELTARLVKLAMQSADRGDRRAFEQWNETLFTLPAWTNSPLDAWPMSLALAELVPLLDADRNDDLPKTCRKLRFWNQPSDPAAPWPGDRMGLKRLIEWSQEMGGVNSARKQASSDASQTEPVGRRHPWIVDQGRDALSPALGLATAISESALDDACKFITETPLPSDRGLVPDARDSHLAVAWPQAIRNALHDEPRLVAAMQTGFGRLGELRLSRAVAEGDALAVRAASVQFLGTPIAASAQLELGDRELALGRFSLALATFQAGLRDASPDQAESLAQRVRLAASFLGMNIGQPARASVSLNSKSLTGEQFESLLEAQRRRAAAIKLLPVDQLTTKDMTGPPSGHYTLRPVVSWAAAAPSKPGEPAAPTRLALFAAQPAGSIYITGALGTVAVGLDEQRIRWSLPLVEDRNSRPHPERMSSAGDRVFWSRTTAEGRELTCLDANSGAIKWHTTRAQLPIISDPIWSQRQLFVVTANPSQQGELRTALCELNPETGDILSQTDLGRLDPDDTVESQCALAAIEDRLVLAAAGAVLFCDRAGHVQWLQRSTWLPADIRNLAPDTHLEFALVVQPKSPLVVLQPGVPGLQAFDLETGRRVWQRSIPDLNRIVGSGAGLVIAITPRGLLAFQAADGAFAWERDLPELPLTCGICNDGQVVSAAVKPGEDGKLQLVLQWFAGPDSHNDSVTSVEIPVPGLSSVAGIGSIGDRYFLIGSSQDHSTAWLLELVQ